MIVEVGAKNAPTSTIFIYILGSKSLGSSLTSQIATKVVRPHVAQNRCKLWCQTKKLLHHLFFICIWFMKFYIKNIFLVNIIYLIIFWSGLLVVIFNITLILLYIYLLILLDFELIFMEFGYRHRALRFNLLSKRRSK